MSAIKLGSEEQQIVDVAPGSANDSSLSTDLVQHTYPVETVKYLSWSAIKFIHAPSSKLLFIASILIFLTLIASLSLGHFIKMDITIEAKGEVSSSEGLKEAVTASEGTVLKVFKKNGESVQAGDLVAVIGTDDLTEEEAGAGLRVLNGLVQTLETLEAGNAHDISLKDLGAIPTSKIHDPTVLQSLVAVEQSLRNWNDSKKQNSDRLVKELRPLEQRSAYLRANIEKMKTSKKKKFLDYYIDSTRDELGKLVTQIASLQNQSLGKIDQAQNEMIHSAQYALATFEAYHAKHEIRSPITGMIAKLNVAASTHIAINKVAATFISTGTKFIARLSVHAKDIGKIHPGQMVYYKLESYPYQQYGLFEGVVESFDTIKINNEEPVANKDDSKPDQGDDFFVRGTLNSPARLPAELRTQISYIHGMKLSGTIVTDRKSLDRVIFERVFPSLHQFFL